MQFSSDSNAVTSSSSQTASLPSDATADILTHAQPKQRRNRKSMRRRSGQKGTVVIQSGFYRVRWRIDVDGQEARINMSQIIVPLVLDKDGNPKPPSPEIRRK